MRLRGQWWRTEGGKSQQFHSKFPQLTYDSMTARWSNSSPQGGEEKRLGKGWLIIQSPHATASLLTRLSQTPQRGFIFVIIFSLCSNNSSPFFLSQLLSPFFYQTSINMCLFVDDKQRSRNMTLRKSYANSFLAFFLLSFHSLNTRGFTLCYAPVVMFVARRNINFSAQMGAAQSVQKNWCLDESKHGEGNITVAELFCQNCRIFQSFWLPPSRSWTSTQAKSFPKHDSPLGRSTFFCDWFLLPPSMCVLKEGSEMFN